MAFGSSHIGSDRLRKAIERNRAKQAKRTHKSRGQVLNAARSTQPISDRPERRFGMQGSHRPPPSRPLPGRLPGSTMQGRLHGEIQEGIRGGLQGGLQGRMQGNFQSNLQGGILRSPDRIATPTKTGSKWSEYTLKATWIFCCFLILRLLFTGGGVIDFYSKKNQYMIKQKELFLVKKDNRLVAEEIVKLKHEAAHQKKLIRGHLGFIAEDEFLILFEK